MVKRKFLSEIYGGSPVSTYPVIGPHFLNQHGMDDFMYIIPEHNPPGPQVPGAPGLLFECDELLCEQAERARIRRLFIRIKSGGIALWIYLGQYNIEPAASLTKEEWILQKTSAKNRWAKKICGASWGKRVRIRIMLRRQLGREPKEVEVSDAEKSENTSEDVNAEDVIRAYDEGLEVIHVWTMKCVDYDKAFQRDICSKYRTWVPRLKKEKHSKPSNASSRMHQHRMKSNNLKRESNDRHASDQSVDGEVMPKVGTHKYPSRGIRVYPR